MAGGVYTTRFIALASATGTHTYTVPAGKRAIVRSASACEYYTTPTSVLFGAGGVCYAVGSLSGTGQSFFSWSGYAVAYAGETLSAVIQGKADVHVDGYLFDDP